MTKPIQVKVLLKNDEAKKFEIVKKAFGLRANSEVLRQLITKEYEKLMKKNKNETKVSPGKP